MTAPNLEDWVAGGRESMIVKLLAPDDSGLRQIASFQPEFTHAIFGAEDQIFGYKNPKIELRYRANDMRPHVKVSHSGKMKPIGDAEPTDIVGLLQEGHHLPKIAFLNEKDFEDSSLQLSNHWSPPGQLHSSYTSSHGTYEIWRGRLDDPAIKQMNLRVQCLVPMFIEGGSYIGERPESDSPDLDLSDADRWTVFLLYLKAPVDGQPDKHTYRFAGLATVYRFYFFHNPTPPSSPDHSWELPNGDVNLEELPCRTRLSQFLILPPFQQKGNGAYLYKAIFEHYLKHPQTQEFNVEDPNEAFDDLRDVCDLAYLRTVPEFAALRIDTSVTIPKKGPIPQLIVGGENIESIRQKTKIFPRQFNRVLEMYLMSQLPDSVRPSMPLIKDGEEVPMVKDEPAPTAAEIQAGKLWGLVVKQRLYRHNKDVLSQIDVSERREKLEETKESVGLEYARVLALYDRAVEHSTSQFGSNGKRKMEEVSSESSKKRARIEDA